MNLKKETILIIFFTIFCLSLFSLYFINFYSKKNSPRIVIKSENNPLKVFKPEPLNSNMNLEQINQTLIEVELKNNKSLEIDDIE